MFSCFLYLLLSLINRCSISVCIFSLLTHDSLLDFLLLLFGKVPILVVSFVRIVYCFLYLLLSLINRCSITVCIFSLFTRDSLLDLLPLLIPGVVVGQSTYSGATTWHFATTYSWCFLCDFILVYWFLAYSEVSRFFAPGAYISYMQGGPRISGMVSLEGIHIAGL